MNRKFFRSHKIDPGPHRCPKVTADKIAGNCADGGNPGSRLRFAAATALVASVVSGAPAMAADITPNPEAAKDKISNCIGCHSIPGYKASFPTVYSVPMIAGQSEKFIANALIAYRKGDRNHPTMKGIAGSLTDQDIADLAAYFSNLE